MAQRKVAAAFIEPMLLWRKENLPEGAEWLYEIKLDGYRALAIKTGRKVQLRSRNDRPRGSETFQQLAQVLTTGEVAIYHPSQPPNTH
jgi:bifunctional non-homologous end joining protein LigD